MTNESIVPDTPARITSTRVLALFASDYAAPSPDGKLHINGGFASAWRFPSYPAILPTLGISAVLELPFQDAMQDRLLRIGLRGPDNQELPVNIEAKFRVAPTLETQFGDPAQVPFAVTVTNVEIPGPGVYHLVLWLDGKEKATYRIRAVQTLIVPNFPGPPQGA
jgi:hypothetical protein